MRTSLSADATASRSPAGWNATPYRLTAGSLISSTVPFPLPAGGHEEPAVRAEVHRLVRPLQVVLVRPKGAAGQHVEQGDAGRRPVRPAGDGQRPAVRADRHAERRQSAGG